MFRPQWHRDNRNHWKGINSSGKPPIEKWKEMGLRFPPGYKEVWVDLRHKKTPVRFLDQEGRIQYQYWPETLKKHRKAHWSRLAQVGSSFYTTLIPLLNKPYPIDDWNDNDIIRLMVKCSLECGIRPGYPKYRDAHDSFGISTLEMKHVKAKPNWDEPKEIIFRFPGKKQVLNECHSTDGSKQWQNALKNYAKWRRQQERTKQDSLFWVHPKTLTQIHPSSLNAWLKENVHQSLKMKDLRTWLVHRHLLEEITKQKKVPAERRKEVWKEMILRVAEQTHHTPAICQSSYLHPKLKEQWMEDTLRVNQERPFLLKLWKM